MSALSLYIDRYVPGGLMAHFSTVAGFLLAFFLIARLMSERKAPANTFAWLLVIVFIPWLGVPLYLLLGGRKLRKLAKDKKALLPVLPDICMADAKDVCLPVSKTVSGAGGYEPVGGNSVRFLLTGEEDFAEIEKHILGARHSIHIATFILSKDATGKRIVDLLARRAREGIKVRLLLDALGCFRTSRGFVDPVRKAGGEVARFMPVLPFTSRGSANLRSHRKIAIFDGTTAIVGGRNFAIEYMGGAPYAKRWRDFGALIEGPAAVVLGEVFTADWCFVTREPPDAVRSDSHAGGAPVKGHCELQVVASGPDVPGDPLYEGIISMIQQAEREISIVTPYYIPDEVLQRSLIVKARAGCRVTVIVPAKSNHPVTDFARRNFTRELIRAGANVLLYNAGMIHAKAIVIDDRVALFGSPNFDLRSLFVNFEIGVFVHTKAEIDRMRAWVEDVKTQCVLPVLSKRSFLTSVAEDVCRLMAPIL
ncbi:MAG TPA: phospholipase D-like domain-containing protein [Opitutaceae bacterium]|jgi:cardiolipin synthase|nr:phospholipase D-like domain-containing protein [Opitutaceae bacterium]